MDWFTGALLSGLVAFVFSNFDDVIFLCLWFGQTKEVLARAQRASQQQRSRIVSPPLPPSPPQPPQAPMQSTIPWQWLRLL